MKLNIKAFAFAGGILWGVSVLVLTWLDIIGYGNINVLSVVKSYYVGYSVTPLGSIIGGVWGFFDAGVGCCLFALLYNKLANN